MANQLPTITPRYLLDTRRYLLLTIGAGLVAALLVVVGILPQIQAILALYSETSEQREKVAGLETKAQQLEQVVGPELLGQIETVNVLLPSKKPLLELLTSLNLVASQTQVNYSGLELSPGSIATDSATTAQSTARASSLGLGGDADVLDVQLRVQGTLDQLNQFFALVERTAPISTITSLSLTPQGGAATLFSEGNVTAPDPLTESPGQARYEAEVVIAAAYFTRAISASVDAALPILSQQQQELLEEITSFTVQPIPEQQDVSGGGLDDLFGVQEPPVQPVN